MGGSAQQWQVLLTEDLVHGDVLTVMARKERVECRYFYPEQSRFYARSGVQLSRQYRLR